MAQGITLTTDWRGNIKVTFDFKKYGDKLMDILRAEGMGEKVEKMAAKKEYSAAFRRKMQRSKRQIERGEYNIVDINKLWD